MSKGLLFPRIVFCFFLISTLIFLPSIKPSMVYAQSGTENPSENEIVTTAGSSDPIYYDVPADYWAFSNIQYLSNLQIIKGYESSSGDKYFNPGGSVTRAQAAKMLVLALGSTPKANAVSSFSDVPNNHWAVGYIERAKELKLFEGFQNGTFGPEDTLKRSQMAKVISEAFDLDFNNYDPSVQVFYDVSKDYWAYDYIAKLYYNGISNGSNHKFTPESLTNRAQFSAFLSRAINPDFRMEVQDPTVATAKVTADVLNIRSQPSTTSTIIGKLSNGNIVTVRSISGDWANIEYNGVVGFVHKMYLKLYSLDPSKPLLNRIIVVDAGHGDHDPGATVGTTYEKDIVLKVSNYLVGYLKNAGAQVIPTRTTDSFLSLEERVNFTKSVDGEAFVSIHVNAASSTAAKGTEVYYDTGSNENGTESRQLAYEIQKQIVADANMYDRNIKDSGFYVIRNNDIPAVLVELGFLTNAEDRAKLTSDTYLQLYAKAIYEGLVEYYKK
ncbi:N-acetylmuramoyl-L-alanine amidase [Bacillus litorisediminis]|uniref:N-acetylmuramoyl-L-alanine amidase n=1 Tax=Bacillus litorisediminis TaxID=2922713 RepID=UPI001FAF1BC0|nr:N-acetylmuramoyl-L-alanine amidase [Bacillus litorisediminis]